MKKKKKTATNLTTMIRKPSEIVELSVMLAQRESTKTTRDGINGIEKNLQVQEEVPSCHANRFFDSKTRVV